jgi:hypothetical protein
MTGEVNGRKVSIFDYAFKPKIRTGQRRMWQQTVMLVESKVKDLPSFYLRPKTVFDSLDGELFEVLNSEYGVRLNKRDYILEAESEAVARNLVQTDIIEYCEEQGGLSIEIHDNQMLCYKLLMRQKISDIANLLQFGLLILDIVETASGH